MQPDARLQRPAAAGVLTASTRFTLCSGAAAAEPPRRWADRELR